MSEIFSTFWFESIVKLLLGFILAGIIGAERESVNKPAGFKTHSLIGISSVLVMLCGEYVRKLNGDIDPTRIPAQLLSGIGFIGAGTILRDGFNVKGLTTAASLLSVTCIGLCIGAGFYLAGVFATIIVYIVLAYSHNLFSTAEHYSNLTINLKIENFNTALSSIQEILDSYKIEIKKIKNSQKDPELAKDLQLTFRYHKNININEVLTKISLLNDVTDLEED